VAETVVPGVREIKAERAERAAVEATAVNWS
jgi:hypothetical protein